MTTAELPEVQALDASTLALLDAAETFVIATPEQYAKSSEVLRDIKAHQKELNDLRLSLTRPLDEAKAGIIAVFKPLGDRLVRAETTLKAAVLTYTQAQDRARAVAEEEAARLRDRADEAWEAGDIDTAEAIEEVATKVVVEKPVAAGVTTRVTWSAEVDDKLALVQAVASGDVPLDAVVVDMVWINSQARTLKDKLAIPGVRAVSTEGVVAQAAR